jgi:hypothetical protein
MNLPRTDFIPSGIGILENKKKLEIQLQFPNFCLAQTHISAVNYKGRVLNKNDWLFLFCK